MVLYVWYYSHRYMSSCICAKILQSCPTLCVPRGCSLPGSSVHGILQARILEWVAMPSSRICHPTFVQIHRMCNTKSEPYGKLMEFVWLWRANVKILGKEIHHLKKKKKKYTILDSDVDHCGSSLCLWRNRGWVGNLCTSLLILL